MRGLVLLSCISALSCGRVGYDPFAGDGAPIDGQTIDATPKDDAAGPFGAATPIASINSSATDVDPSITADLRQLFFNSNRTGNFEIYVSVRANPGDAWPAPTIVDAGIISTAALEQNPAISADGLTLYFTRTGDIHQATRSSPTGTFNAPTPIDDLNTAAADTFGSITPDELTATFFSTRLGSQVADIYIANRPDVGSPWTVELIPGDVNGPTVDADSFLTADRLTLFFDSDRGGASTDYNIYVSSRAAEGKPFDPPVPVTELNTAQADGDVWLTPDGRTIYFSSGPIFTNLDIHEATR